MTAGRELDWFLLQPVFKQMILFLIKKYPGLFGEGYFGGRGLKKLKIYSRS